MATFESWPISSSEVELASRVPIIQLASGDISSTVYNLSFQVPIMLSSNATLSRYWFKVVLFTHPFNTSNWTEDETTISGIHYWYYRRSGSSSTRMSATQYKDAITNESKGGSGTILYDSKWIKSDLMYQTAKDAIAHPLTISLDFTDGGDSNTGTYTSGIPAYNFSQGLCVAFICTTDTDPNDSAPTELNGYSYFEMPSNQKIYNITGITSADYYTITYYASDQNTFYNWPSNVSVQAGQTFTVPSIIPYRQYDFTNTNVTLNYNYSGSTNETKIVKKYKQDRIHNWQDQDGGTNRYERGSSYTPTKNLTLSPASGWWGEDITTGFTLPTPSRTGYSFQGWYSASSGGTKLGNGGDNYTNTSYSTIYAHWNANTYTVTYNANGGSNAPQNQTKTYGVPLTLTSSIPTRTGYNFIGWGTSSSATTATYQPGDSYTSNSSITLYAIWEVASYITTLPYFTSPTASTQSKVRYYDGTKFVPISTIHYYNGSSWVEVGNKIPFIE